MSTFLERIRERARRANAKRAKRRRGAPEATPAPARWLSAADDVDLGAVAAGEQPKEQEIERPGDAGEHHLHREAEEIVDEGDLADIQDDDLADVEESIRAEEAQASGEVTTGPAAPEPAAKAPSAIRLEFAKSSNVRAAELGADGVVAVEFRDGAIYRYANFTLELMAEWEAAKSAGSWFHHNVRSKPDRHPIVEA